ncbi:MAG: SpoIIE family protein phosphatase [Lachnospiraceae bacterium]|nr:SpoIIE family protein phosphatase [Lachnospiraceae bacterium]
MRIRACVSTDTGSGRGACTDAAVLKVANSSRYGRIAFAVLCDGDEESYGAGKASAIVAERMAEWFQDELPEILQDAELELMHADALMRGARMLTEVLKTDDMRAGFSSRTFDRAQERIRMRLQEIADELNTRITGFGRLHHMHPKTAMTCLLLMGREYLIMRIGPTRAYLTTGEGRSVRMPAEEDPARIFGQEGVRPVFVQGRVEKEAGVLLYSDGFIRKQDPDRLRKLFHKYTRYSERRLDDALRKLTRFVRKQGERDDAFAVFLSCVR